MLLAGRRRLAILSGTGRSSRQAVPMSKAVSALLKLLALCLLYTVVGALVGGVLFLPFGLLGWLFTSDITALVIASGFGGVIGALFGFAQTFLDYFRKQPAEPEKDEESVGEKAAGFYLGPLKPDWFAIFDVLKWFATKDFSKQKPGRLKRALIGAVGCAAVALFLIVMVSMVSSTRSPDALSFGELTLFLVLPAAAIGAILGALSDSL
jgi:hypothetical protein